MSISIVSSAKSVARRLKYQSKLISNLESRAAAQDMVIRSLVTELNSQVRYSRSAVHAAYLLCHSLSSDSGPAPQEDYVLSDLSDANCAVDIPDPVPHHAQCAIEACIPDPVQEVAQSAIRRPYEAEIVECFGCAEAPCPVGWNVERRSSTPVDQAAEPTTPVSSPVKQITADAPISVERTVERVEAPCPVGRIVERRCFVPADQIVDQAAESVAPVPSAQAPHRERHVPILDEQIVEEDEQIPFCAAKNTGSAAASSGCDASRWAAVRADVYKNGFPATLLGYKEVVQRAVQRPYGVEATEHVAQVPADQIVERVIQVPFTQAPCQEHVPVCDMSPVPQEVVSTQDVAVDANARVEVDGLHSDPLADAHTSAAPATAVLKAAAPADAWYTTYVTPGTYGYRLLNDAKSLNDANTEASVTTDMLDDPQETPTLSGIG